MATRVKGAWHPGRSAWREIRKNVRDIQASRCATVVNVHVDSETFEAICEGWGWKSGEIWKPGWMRYFWTRERDPLGVFTVWCEDGD